MPDLVSCSVLHPNVPSCFDFDLCLFRRSLLALTQDLVNSRSEMRLTVPWCFEFGLYPSPRSLLALTPYLRQVRLARSQSPQ